MINLLPPDSVKQLRASRQNTVLSAYLLGMFIVVGVIIAIYVFAFALLKSTQLSNENTSRDNNARVAKYAAVSKQTQEFTTDLQTAKQLFSNSVSYSNALINIARALPNNVILNDISLTPTTLTTPSTITANAKSYESALSLKQTFEQSGIAKNVSIISITNNQIGSISSAPGGANKDYPFQISLNLTFQPKLLDAPDKVSAQESKS